MKILLPIDGSDYTKRMLAYVAAHDEMFAKDCDIAIFTAVAPIQVHLAKFISKGAVDEYHRSQAEAVLEPVRAFARQSGWNFRDSYVVGHASESIAARVDKERPDLVVMGSHGHSSFAGVMVGSVVAGVLARCKAPLLIVR